MLTRKTCYPGYEIELTPYKINLRKPQSFFYFKKLMFNMKSNNKAKKKKKDAKLHQLFKPVTLIIRPEEPYMKKW